MSYVKPDAVVDQMVHAGAAKARLGVSDLLVRGFLAGALLGFATTLAFTATQQTHVGLVGALVFPVGFVMIVLLGLELVTGNFALLPLALRERRIGLGELLGNWGLVFAANLAGSVFYAWLFTLTVAPDSEMARQLIVVAEAKTLGYAKLGVHGVVVAVAKALLCNWMVTLGVVMALTSQSTGGKIAAMWLPILTFFAQGFEHSVVNMMGAGVSARDWWLWNQLPVTVGNIVGGALFTGMALQLTYRRRAAHAAEVVVSAAIQGEMAAGR